MENLKRTETIMEKNVSITRIFYIKNCWGQHEVVKQESQIWISGDL